MTIRNTTIDLLSSIFGKPFVSLPVAELELNPVVYHKTLDEIIRKMRTLQKAYFSTSITDQQELYCDKMMILAQVVNLETCFFDRESFCRSFREDWSSGDLNIHYATVQGDYLCPPLEMATEWDMVNCLLYLYGVDFDIRDFIRGNNLHERLLHYQSTLIWLFSDSDKKNGCGKPNDTNDG